MTIVPPAPGEPRRPDGPRDPGDAWVVAADGTRYWGRFGAAGLLAVDSERGVLLQHRVAWSHFGDTWGLPGGARHEDESAPAAALREAAEEAGVPAACVRLRFVSVFDAEIWNYATVVADVTEPFDAVISDPESRALAWVPVADVDDYPLHPGFAAAWPRLRGLLETRPAIVVDAANVVGSVPDGWWRDRVGATDRLISSLTALAARGLPAEALDLPERTWFPQWRVVVEGQARGAADAAGLEIVRAAGAGDDTIVDEAAALVAQGRSVTVVTSDRALTARGDAVGARVRQVSWLRDLT